MEKIISDEKGKIIPGNIVRYRLNYQLVYQNTTPILFSLLLLLFSKAAISFEVGHSWYYHDYPNAVPGKYNNPQSVCDVRGETWSNPLVFVPNQYYGQFSHCHRYAGSCRDTIRGGNMAYPQLAFYCPDGFGSGGNSCSNAVCIRHPDMIDPMRNAGNSCPELLANPIHVGNGNKYQLETDLLPTDYGRILIQRTYNSYPNSSQPFKEHWRFFYTQRLDVRRYVSNTPSSVFANRPDGAVEYFTQSGTIWSSEGDVEANLEELTDENGIQTGWRYISANNSFEEYSLDGKLLSITDIRGSKQTATYNSSSNLLERIDTNTGKYLIFSFDAQLRIISISDQSSPAKVWGYRYDDNGNLEFVDYPDGTTKQYHYENNAFPHALTGITDENGNRYATWSYDEQGRAISSEHANGVDRTTMVYNPDGTTSVTNPLGKQTTYHFTTLHGVRKVTQVEGHPSASCEGANKEYTYDANGFLSSKTDWNGVSTNYVHNDRGLETSRTEAVSTPQARTITTEWHAEFNLPTRIVEAARETLFSYDPQGRLTDKTVKPRQ